MCQALGSKQDTRQSEVSAPMEFTLWWGEQTTNKINKLYIVSEVFPRWRSGQEAVCQCRRRKRLGLDPWVEKIPNRRKYQPTPVFLSGKFHGRGARRATVHGVTKSWTGLSVCIHARAHIHAHIVFERTRSAERNSGERRWAELGVSRGGSETASLSRERLSNNL